MHEKRHLDAVMDQRFYENDFVVGKSSELEIMRSPFYDLAREEKLDSDGASQLIDEISQKLTYVEGLEVLLQPPVPTKENIAYTRYADVAEDQASRDLFQFPRGAQFRIIDKAELFRIQKWTVGEDRWQSIRRSKAFIADKFFPPFELKEGNLKALLHDKAGVDAYSKPEDSVEFMHWKQQLLDLIPHLNHDVNVQLALHLAYEAKVNDKQIWRAIEDATYASLHHMTLTQVSQLEWATQELKPKQVTPRLNTLLMKRAIDAVDGGAAATPSDFIDLLQGFRHKKSKDLY